MRSSTSFGVGVRARLDLVSTISAGQQPLTSARRFGNRAGVVPVGRLHVYCPNEARNRYCLFSYALIHAIRLNIYPVATRHPIRPVIVIGNRHGDPGKAYRDGFGSRRHVSHTSDRAGGFRTSRWGTNVIEMNSRFPRPLPAERRHPVRLAPARGSLDRAVRRFHRRTASGPAPARDVRSSRTMRRSLRGRYIA